MIVLNVLNYQKYKYGYAVIFESSSEDYIPKQIPETPVVAIAVRRYRKVVIVLREGQRRQ